MRIELVNGSTIQILGTDNLDVVGGNYYGVVFSEYQNQNPLAWDFTRPILAENGGWAWFNGTPRGENHLHAMLTCNRDNARWFTQVLSVDDTNAITQADIDEEIRSGMRPSLVRQEFYCDFSAPNENAIYGKLMSDAMGAAAYRRLPVDGRSPVHTFWDLGGPKNTVVWYGQRLPFGRFRWVDVDYGLTVDSLAARIAYMNAKGYTWGKHFLPHDAHQTGRHHSTFYADVIAAGLKNVVVVPPIHDVWTGINYVAELMPSFEWRTPACEVGVKGLKGYESAPDGSSGVVKNTPLHTWASHVADAMRTMAEADRLGLVPSIDVMNSKPKAQPVRATMGLRAQW